MKSHASLVIYSDDLELEIRLLSLRLIYLADENTPRSFPLYGI